MDWYVSTISPPCTYGDGHAWYIVSGTKGKVRECWMCGAHKLVIRKNQRVVYSFESKDKEAQG